MRKTVTAIATTEIPFGQFLRLEGEVCSPAEISAEGGIAMRPHYAGFSKGYSGGDEVTVLVSGGALCSTGDGSCWVELRDGRVI